ncbi:MAG: hypothetical protein SOT71_10180 [Romboutsia timonensis]|uniref:hypothetical protein n=1 Tax=Romboutsia timonensis TaxID=1776391 RepID=UPI002A74D459|nr:hypothetical protein [Romboutsia timonensis]MDY2883007.1 hypothetical protein [Romboutsia timonensis]
MKNKTKSKIKCVILGTLTIIIVAIIYSGIQKDNAVVAENEKVAKKINDQIDEKNKKDKEIFKTLPIVSCWGDSLTVGVGGDGITYPRELSLISGLKVYNYGVEDDSTYSIASRQGAIPIYTKSFIMPANKEPVEISLYDQYRQEYILTKPSAYGVNTCEINGIKGTLSYDPNRQVMYFTRVSSGKELKIKEGTQLFTSAMLNKNKNKNEILIIFTGNNDKADTSIGSIVTTQKKMIDYAGTDKYIVIGFTGDGASYKNNVLAEEYGDNFLNIKKYLIEHGLKDAKIIPSKQDELDIANASIPSSLISGGINGNYAYYKIVAQQVLQKIIDLGYLNNDQIEYLGIEKQTRD